MVLNVLGKKITMMCFNIYLTRNYTKLVKDMNAAATAIVWDVKEYIWTTNFQVYSTFFFIKNCER